MGQLVGWLKRPVANFFVVFLGCFGFGLVFFFRFTPALVAPEILDNLGKKAEPSFMGTLGGFYFWPYALTQPIGGLLADMMPPGVLMGGSLILAAFGTLLTAMTKDPMICCLSRVLVGIGCGPIYVPANGLLKNWFPDPNVFALWSGVLTASGSIGGLLAQGPLGALMKYLGSEQWRVGFYLAAVIGLVLAVFCFIFLKSTPEEAGYTENDADVARPLPAKRPVNEIVSSALKGMWQVTVDGRFWRLMIFSSFCMSVYFNVASLYGAKYLPLIGYEEKSQIGFLTSFLSIGWIIGSPTLAKIQNGLRSRKKALIFCCLGGIVSCIGFYFTTADTSMYLVIVYFLIMGYCTGSVIGTPTVMNKEMFPEAAATAMGMGNFFPFFMTGVYQIICPKIVNWVRIKLGQETENLTVMKFGLWGFSIASLLVATFGALISSETYKDPSGKVDPGLLLPKGNAQDEEEAKAQAA